MAYSGAYRPNREEPEQPSARKSSEEREVKSVPEKGKGNFPLSLAGLFQKTEAVGMETDDLLMALVLYLMYRESGDKDLLIMLAAMLLT